MQYEGLISDHDVQLEHIIKASHDYAPQMEKFEIKMKALDDREVEGKKLDKKMDDDMSDLIEYTKWMSGEVAKMR